MVIVAMIRYYIHTNADILFDASIEFKYKQDDMDQLFRKERYIIRANGDRIDLPDNWNLD